MKIEEQEPLFKTIFNSLPLPVFRVTEDVEILDMNQAAEILFNTSLSNALRQKGGDIMRCINAVGTPMGCGKEVPCRDCMIRNSVVETYKTGQGITRQATLVEVIDDEGIVQQQNLLLTVSPIRCDGELSILLCIEDITELVRLRSMIPICSNCKKIRDDNELWKSVEEYFSKFARVDFTHSICPDCVKELYGDLFNEDKRPVKK